MEILEFINVLKNNRLSLIRLSEYLGDLKMKVDEVIKKIEVV